MCGIAVINVYVCAQAMYVSWVCMCTNVCIGIYTHTHTLTNETITYLFHKCVMERERKVLRVTERVISRKGGLKIFLSDVSDRI